jgi:ADP-ribosylglycohydrolase
VASGQELLQRVLEGVPSSAGADGLQRALRLSSDTTVHRAVQTLGNGSKVTAQDTVPFVLWMVSHSLANFERALWQTASGLGDIDTTCAMVGGIVALAAGRAAIPQRWRTAREMLPQLLPQQ